MPSETPSRTTIVRGGFVIPGARSETLADGAVLVEGPRIAAVGPYADLRRLHPDAPVAGSASHVVMPGLVNAHHHGFGLTPLQLGAPDDFLETWLLDVHSALRRMPDAYLDTLAADAALLRSGVTAVAHLSYPRWPDRLMQETAGSLRAHRQAGIRACYGVSLRDRFRFVYHDDDAFVAGLPASVRASLEALHALAPDPGLDERMAAYDLARDLVADEPRLGAMFVAEGPGWCTDELLERIAERAVADGVPVHMHLLETALQRDSTRALYGRSAVEHLAALGFLDAEVAFGHAVWLSDSDIELCAAHGVTICHNPTSNLRLRSGVMPLRAMREAGVRLALGSDSCSVSEQDDFLLEMRLATLLHRLPGEGGFAAPALGTREVLEMATAGGVRAMGHAGGIGELAPGAPADIVLLRLDEIRGAHLDHDVDLVEALVCRGTARAVDTVMVAGEVVVEGGRCTRFDEDALLAELRAAVLPRSDPRMAAWNDAATRLRPHIHDFYRDWRPAPTSPTEGRK